VRPDVQLFIVNRQQYFTAFSVKSECTRIWHKFLICICGSWRKLHVKSFMVFASYQIVRWANQGHVACVQDKRNALTVLLGNPEDLCVDGRTVLKLLQKEQFVRSQTVFTVPWIWKSGRLFWTWLWTFRFHIMHVISSLAEKLPAYKADIAAWCLCLAYKNFNWFRLQWNYLIGNTNTIICNVITIAPDKDITK